MNKIYWLVLVVFFMINCSSSDQCQKVELGENIILGEGEQVIVEGTDLWIKVTKIIEGLDGSHVIGVGSVDLLVNYQDEQDMEIYMETGNIERIGEYSINFKEVIFEDDQIKVKLLVK
jgi:hypothetical protein